MSKADEIVKNLTGPARTALINAGTSRRGAFVPARHPETLADLYALDLIGRNNGITRLGTIVRERIMDQEMTDFDA